MRLKPLSFFASLLALATADVDFTSPTPGSSTAEGSISVGWQDGSGPAPLSSLGGWQLFLVAGGDTDANAQIITSTTGSHAGGGTTTTIKVPAPATGPPGQNAYYLKMISQGTSGGQLINYSQRFTITGMTGSWQSQSIEDAYTSAKGDVTKVPATANQLASNQNNPAAGGAGGPQFTVPYGMQTTGLTKYAPMQQHPPTAITKQDTSPLFPTTAFNVAQSALPTATQLTTLTASITYSYATRVNTAAPAPAPADDMQKFLNRWKD